MDNLLKSPKGGNIRKRRRRKVSTLCLTYFPTKNISLSESLAIMIYYILYITNVNFQKKSAFSNDTTPRFLLNDEKMRQKRGRQQKSSEQLFLFFWIQLKLFYCFMTGPMGSLCRVYHQKQQNKNARKKSRIHLSSEI